MPKKIRINGYEIEYKEEKMKKKGSKYDDIYNENKMEIYRERYMKKKD